MNNIYAYVIFIISLCAAPARAEQILSLPHAVNKSCAIVRGHPVYLGSSSYYDKKEGFEFEYNRIWAIDIVDVYRWNLPKLRHGQRRLRPSDVPRRITYVVPWGTVVLKYQEVIMFLECDCRYGYVFTDRMFPLNVDEEEQDGVTSKFIRGWTIIGLGKGKIPLEDFAKAVKKESKKPNRSKKSLGPDPSGIYD